MDYSGLQYDQIYTINFLSGKEQKKSLQDIFSTLPNLNILNYSFDNNWDEAKFHSEINLESQGFAKIYGNNMTLNVFPSEISTTNLKKDDNRKFPFEIQYGYVDEAEFEIKIPKEYKANLVFEPIVYNSEFGEYQLNVTAQNDYILKVTRKI